MDRAHLLSSTVLPAYQPLLDSAGVPLPSTRPSIDIDALPLITADALPPLPEGMQARLLVPANGAVPEIVLWVPAHEVSLCVPLTEKHRITEAAADLSRAIARAVSRA